MPKHINRVTSQKDVALHHARTVIHYREAVRDASYSAGMHEDQTRTPQKAISERHYFYAEPFTPFHVLVRRGALSTLSTESGKPLSRRRQNSKFSRLQSKPFYSTVQILGHLMLHYQRNLMVHTPKCYVLFTTFHGEIISQTNRCMVTFHAYPQL